MKEWLSGWLSARASINLGLAHVLPDSDRLPLPGRFSSTNFCQVFLTDMTSGPQKSPEEIREKRARKQRIRQVEKLASFFAQAISASLLMMWAVFNTVHNIVNFNQQPKAENNTEGLLGLVLMNAFGIIPFAIGMFWLWRILARNKPTERNTDNSTGKRKKAGKQ